jgi:UPF0755 protein
VSVKRAIICVVSLALGLGGAAVTAVVHALSPAVVGNAEATEQSFMVRRGATMGKVARELEAVGLIRSATAIEWLARANGIAGELRAGEYALSGSLSSRQILDHLTKGRVVTYRVGLPEGIRASEIAQRLSQAQLADADAFLEAVADAELAKELGVEGETLEGYLYPETYRFSRGLDPREIAATMVDQFLRVWKDIAPLAEERGMSMREVVTLASIVEKETGAPEERPVIAAVFLNRLDRGMRLETDPAVIYGIEDFDGNIKKKHLLDPSNPYNTYRHSGLPPGPIASPGADALRAVVEPAQSDYLFFVSMNDGTHKFSRTYREHANAVNRYQKRRRSK